MFVDMSDNRWYSTGRTKYLCDIIRDVCNKYNIAPDKVYFDYVQNDVEYHNMRIYGIDSLCKMIGITCNEDLINNDGFWSNVERVEHPNDTRGFWYCRFCMIICLNPLKFNVDGILFTILL